MTMYKAEFVHVSGGLQICKAGNEFDRELWTIWNAIQGELLGKSKNVNRSE